MSQQAYRLCQGIKTKVVEAVKEAIHAGANVNNILPGYSYNSLYLAIEENFVDAIEILIRSGAEINFEDWWYNCHTPLTFAIYKGSVEIVKLLIAYGADVNRVHSDGDTPLTHAVRLNKVQIADYLMEQGADVNQPGWKGLTPLSWSISKDNKEATRVLMARGADVTAPNLDGTTPVNLAETSENEEMLDLLHSFVVVENEPRDFRATVETNGTVDKRKVDYSEDLSLVDSTGNTPLLNALEDDKLYLVEQILLAGADPCKPGAQSKTPLQIAVLKKDQKAITLLLNHGAEHTIQTAFYEALILGDMEIVKLLVERGAVINIVYKTGSTPLTKAIEKGNFDIVQYLVESGANINMPDRDGNLPLVLAVTKENPDIVRFLIKKAKPPDSIIEKCPFLLRYIDEHNFDMVQSLVETGVKLNVVFETGNSPLTKAVQMEDFKIVKFLVDKGANVNQPDKSGKTPLAVAAAKHNLRIVKFLIASRADIKMAKKEVESFAHCNDDFAIYLDLMGGKYKEWERSPPDIQVRADTEAAETTPETV